MSKHTVQEKSEFYVLCLKRASNGECLYWGSKSGTAWFRSGLSQATHYNDLRSAKSKKNLAMRKRDTQYDKNDEVFVGKATATVTIEEVQKEKNMTTLEERLKTANTKLEAKIKRLEKYKDENKELKKKVKELEKKVQRWKDIKWNYESVLDLIATDEVCDAKHQLGFSYEDFNE